MKKDNNPILFENYRIENLDLMCAELWPIVSDYLIDEIDNNALILKDSVSADSIIKCIEYICTDESAILFRNGRAVFSVIIRLYQTNKLSDAELGQSLYDNHKLLLKWFEILIQYTNKEKIDNMQLQRFYTLFSAHINKDTKVQNFVSYALSSKV